MIIFLTLTLIFLLLPDLAHADPFGITAAISGALASIGGGSAAAGAAIAGSTAAAVGSTVAGLTQKAPAPKIVAPPSPVKGEEAAAAVTSKRLAGLGYKSTILSQQYQNTQNQYGKTKLGA